MRRCLDRPLRVLLALLALGVAAGILAPATIAQEKGTPQLVHGGTKPDVVLMYTGDVIGYIEPCG
jgi:hypothetical protein